MSYLYKQYESFIISIKGELEKRKDIEESKEYEYQCRDIDGGIYYKREKGDDTWEFISEEEFEKNANKNNIVEWNKEV